MSTRHLLVTGRVQGVGFREATRAEAERLGLSGWVRNLADGRVEAVATGPDPAVTALVAWCARGSPSARVEGVFQEAWPDEASGQFRVLRGQGSSAATPGRAP
jgi:acylphosphatase